ncbi:MAG: hypothetical protein AAF211_09560 [Myxococcota bacterium]
MKAQLLALGSLCISACGPRPSVESTCADLEGTLGGKPVIVVSAETSGSECLRDVRGSVYVEGPGPVQLPTTRQIAGDLVLAPELAALTAPALQQVGRLVVTNTALQSIGLPKLRSVERLGLYRLPALTNLEAPELVSIDQDLRVVGNDALGAVTLPSLEHVGGTIDIADNRGLTPSRIWTPRLERADRVSIAGNREAVSCDPEVIGRWAAIRPANPLLSDVEFVLEGERCAGP